MLFKIFFSSLFFSAAIASAEPIQIKLKLIEIKGAQLARESLPDEKLKIVDRDLNRKQLDVFRLIVQNFNTTHDTIIDEIFQPLHLKKKFDVQVVATSGVPSPYDAWTASHNGIHTIFFNLDEWPEGQLQKSGSAVLNHEVTHILLKPLLRRPKASNFIEQLDYIVINEGVAHFVGYPKDRNSLLSNRKSECEKAELELKSAKQKLEDSRIDRSVKAELLKRSNTGPFWEKYGAMSGMCRAAKIYSTQGVAALTNSIKSGRL